MKKLLFSITKKDFDIDYFSGTGAGGQYRNKHQNCVRLKHADSGVTVTGQSNRDRKSNLREAFNNLVSSAKFKAWHTRRVWECINKKTVEEIVDDSMVDNNILVEVFEGGRWNESKM